MIKSRLFRTHFAIAAISILGFVFVGSWLLSVVVMSIEVSQDKHRRQRQTPIFFANFIEQFGEGNPEVGLAKLRKLQGPGDPIQFTLLDAQGKPITPVTGEIPPILHLPEIVHEAEDIAPGPPPHGGIFDILGSRPPGPPPFSVLRLNSSPVRFLLIKFRPPPGPPMGHFFPLSVLVMIAMVLLGIAVALSMIFRSLREHVQSADRVISELQSGNLKARFPIARQDEIGNAKARFNAMADEIERLVERLRSAESSRNNLLQELAHDLRTPVASLQSIHESVFGSVTMPPEVQELADLARKEADYMGHLVEDLLLLAQLSEPSYKPHCNPVDFMGLLEEEADSLALRKDNIRLVKNFRITEALVRGDEHLFRRLVRNSLENAFSYAKGKVEVGADVDPNGQLRVSIRDDGPGFDAEALSKFGERRGQRMIKKTQGGRLSLGLGSVIMKSVISLHRGELHVANTISGGAFIEFTLPPSP